MNQFAGIVIVLVACAICGPVDRTVAQEVPPPREDLSIEQARLADRYARLEMVLVRLAELSASTDPRRARLLREAIVKSREQDFNRRFETIVSLLEEERLSAAASRQTDLQAELDELLKLLLKANRDQELESQHRRIKAYLQEVGRLIRLEKALQARTEGGDDADRLAKDQQQVADQTGELADSISETERRDDGGGEPGPAESPDGPSKSDESRPNDANGESPEKGSPSADSPDGGAPQKGEQSPGGESDGQGGEPGESSPGSPEQSDAEPTDRAAQRLKSAQQRMRNAQHQIEEANRKGAASEQRAAVKELEQAKAELERVLRQLREEELERTLTLLAARFRRMLDAQLKVYKGTVQLDRVPRADRSHDQEIEAARLSREESLIVLEADRALVLLREDGSSVAFPETVGLMRADMQQVTERLAELKVGALTQGLEQDIIEALEETIAALEKALKDQEQKRPPPGQPPAAGQPMERPLVDKLAELRMIRSLQMRINRRTQRYGTLIEGEQADAPELLEALLELAERQQRVYQATDDLSQGRND